jgi:hypothetical protein
MRNERVDSFEPHSSVFAPAEIFSDALRKTSKIGIIPYHSSLFIKERV